jgi:hypothetical protein
MYTQRISHSVVFARCGSHSFMSSESFRHQMDSSSSAILLLYAPQRQLSRGLVIIGVLLTLAGGEGQDATIYSVTEACGMRYTYVKMT